MGFFKEMTVKESTRVKAPVEKVWEFFGDMEKNYLSWHPEEHIMYKVIKGNKHEKGCVVYAEEYILGKKAKVKVMCTDVVPYRRTDYATFFPLSLFHPRSTYLFEPDGKYCTFTAINYFRIPMIFKNRVLAMIKATEQHMKEEGENLQKLLET